MPVIEEREEFVVGHCEECPFLDRPDYNEAIGPGPFPGCRHPLVLRRQWRVCVTTHGRFPYRRFDVAQGMDPQVSQGCPLAAHPVQTVTVVRHA